MTIGTLGAYGAVVSLGFNCEVEFQLERIGLRERQPVFAWMFVQLPALTKIVAHSLSDLADPANVVFHEDKPTMLYDNFYGCYYHSPKELTSDHPRAARLMQIFHQSVVSAAESFNANARSPTRTLYLLKIESSRSLEDVTRLRDAVATSYPGHDFQIAVIREGIGTDMRWQDRRISQHVVRRFAPIEAAMDGSIPCWDEVFREIGIL